MRIRYADGRAAVTHEVECELGADALSFSVGETRHTWAYADLKRTDDDNGRVGLKRRPDTGERVFFEDDAAALRTAAPALFTPQARGIERPVVVGALAGVAATLAAAFLIGVPLSAGPIADSMPPQYRDQISDISWSQVNAFSDYCDDGDEASRILNSMAHRMMTAADIPQRDNIWITIVDAPIPNAFALPDESIIITADLIELAEHPDEIAGVIAHEIAHIERNHVMKNIVGNIGAGIFFDVVFGGAGVGQAIAVASVNLAGLRYSRDFEREADARGMDFLDAARIDTAGIASLFDHLRDMEREAGVEDVPTLLATHPNSAARAEAARERSRPGLEPSLTEAEWRIVQSACGRGGAQAPDDETGPPAQQSPGEQPAPAPDPNNPEPARPKLLNVDAKRGIVGLPSAARAG